MYIHEYQAKTILYKFGLPIPKGFVVKTKNNIESKLKNFKHMPLVVKAQAYTGGRGKCGGVLIAKTVSDARKKIESMLGMKIVNAQTGSEGKTTWAVYVEQAISIKKEFYLSIIIDRAIAKPTIIFSAAGGINIEELAKKDMGQIIKIPIDITTGPMDFQIRQIIFGAKLNMACFKELKHIIIGIYNAFITNDASQIEINPLALDMQNNLVILDAKMTFDDNALYRQPNITKLYSAKDSIPSEVEAAKNDLSFIKMDGNIGCVVNGAGLAMATMDIIMQHGGSLANFLDIGGTANVESISKAIKIVLDNHKVKTILINIFAGIVKADMVADSIISTIPTLKTKPNIIIRLLGTNSEYAKQKLQEANINVFFTSNIEEAVQKAVANAKQTG
ncbi:Succinate--CoA ligase (ADP-forming) subunit beta [Candidatus Xenohaliotis californiensis]|uniref:Succinate--CoA ligase [ADP-forming] subunit beta n=1 Tax=Candidatus Xenohaliotis californiensis TaxID=84677 RepID=A0ABM9N7P7_9RICK|nr:Succinate--CoA ligase (ADP-forming) subunit beta [Candidatus Xenohaliotis californiensis]